MNYVPETPFTSPLLKKVIENSKKDEPTKALSIQIGFFLVISFLAVAAFAPQIGDKLGTLSLKKNQQSAYAAFEERKKLVDLINDYRSSYGKGVLPEDQILTNSACWMSRYMADNDTEENPVYGSHYDNLGRDPTERAIDSGMYSGDSVGENIDASRFTADEVFNSWKNSPGHDAMMLFDSPPSIDITRIGVGVAYNANSRYKIYWTMDIATSRSNQFNQLTTVSSDCSYQPQNQDPQGALDGPNGTINCETINITGWADDPDTPTQSTEIHIYFDGPAGQGTGFPGIIANASDNRFSWPIPQQFRTGTHSVYAYAINTQPGNNPLLGGSPRTFTCQPPPTTVTVSPNPCLIPSTQGSCEAAIRWESGTQGSRVCLDSITTPIGQGPSGQTTQFLSANTTHTINVRESSCSGTIRASTTVSVYKIDQSAGDVDCDGDIDSVDALHILRKVANLPINPSICNGAGFNLAKADVKDDNIIDAVDALFVLRIVAGLINLSPPSFLSNYADTDYDLMTDAEEDSYSCLSKTTSDAVRNSDNDWLSFNGRRFGLTNIAEIAIKSNPCALDSDGDGFGDVAEVYVGTKADQRCGTDGWPADFISGGIPDSTNKITINDLNSFLAPIRRLDTSPGDPGYSPRWDLVPGKGVFAKDINIQDLSALTTLAPPMFNGIRAFNGPICSPN